MPEFKKLVFEDDFNGIKAGEPLECYLAPPKCTTNLRTFQEGPCPQGVNWNAIRALNKCKWNVWQGYSFWESTGRTSFQPDLIEVSGGVLKLKLRTKNPNPLNCNDNKLDCVLEGAGLDSRRTFKSAKIEIKARMKSAANAFQAYWTWTKKPGEGIPYPVLNEYDLIEARSRVTGVLEGWQTVHDWTKGGAPISQKSSIYQLKSDDWHIYKLERTPSRVRLWIDDCLTLDRSQDEKVPGSENLTLGDGPSFLILWQTGEFWYGGVEHLNGVFSEIDWVRIYEEQ